jgi:hypothetical protein
MGVAGYRISRGLPEGLRVELSASVEFARAFPLGSLVQFRIEIERELRSLLTAQGSNPRRAGITPALVELQQLGIAPDSIEKFRMALAVFNRTAHGVEVDADAATDALAIGAAFLAELQRLASEGPS